MIFMDRLFFLFSSGIIKQALRQTQKMPCFDSSLAKLHLNTTVQTDNSEIRTAAVNATNVTEAATVKKPTGRRSDGTSEKEVEAEAFKKPWVNCLRMPQNLNLSRRPNNREH